MLTFFSSSSFCILIILSFIVEDKNESLTKFDYDQ